MSMREGIEEWIEHYESTVTENARLRAVIQFWRKKWLEEQTLPDRFDQDRKERIRSIFLLKTVLSTDPDTDLVQACKVFDTFPRVGE